MSRFVAGQEVMIPCAANRNGPPGEAVVEVQSASGPLSGFVNLKAVTGNGDQASIRGWIVEVSDDRVVVQVPGSFFRTAAGKAWLSAAWADANLQPIVA